MKIIVLNLDRAHNRRERIIKELEKNYLTDYLIYPAFDGSHIQNNSFDPKIMPPSWGAGREMKRGEIGCTISHIGMISLAKSLNLESVIILEDDAVLCSDFLDRLTKLFKMLPKNWDHVFLGGHVYQFQPLIIPSLSKSPKVSGTYAYMLNKTAYQKVIHYLSKLTTTTDDLYEQLIRNEEINSYIFFPLFVYPLQEYSYIWEEKGKFNEHPSKVHWRDLL